MPAFGPYGHAGSHGPAAWTVSAVVFDDTTLYSSKTSGSIVALIAC
jgi:hypothetical protein